MRKETREIIFNNELRAKKDNEQMLIEGHFAVFNKETELWKGFNEEISPGAFNNTLNKDIRALTDHNTEKVLGRTKNNTLELKTDETGLYGIIKVNEKDTEAVNLYERVKRGDVDGCSFGFYINQETITEREDGSVHSLITDVDLLEVSVCTFPAYEDTKVSVRNMAERKEDIETELNKRKKYKNLYSETKERIEKLCQ